MVTVKKTIRCKIINPTKIKDQQLTKEYNHLQTFLQLERLALDFLPIYNTIKKNLHSANAQQVLRFYKTIKEDVKYPISIRNDQITIKKTTNKLSEYWVKIPIKQRRGGIKLAIKSQPFDFENYKICESKLYKSKNKWFINIVVQKEIQLNNAYSSILALDLGEKYMCCSVDSKTKKPIFYGKEVRGIRRKYAYIRKQLGKKKLLKVIKRIGQKEQRIISDHLHNISNDIVNLAVTNSISTIALGDLKGIRNGAKNKGRRFNRIVSNMPFFQLTEMITYKANWKGINVIKISEAYTSKTCSKCGSRNTVRTNQANFKCKECNYQINADFNGAINILNRSLGYMLKDGASLTMPKTGAI